MIFIRYFGRLLKEFFGFARKKKAWWMLPVVILLLLLTFLIFAGQATAPFIYTLF